VPDEPEDKPTPAQRLVLVVVAFGATAVLVIGLVWAIAVIFS